MKRLSLAGLLVGLLLLTGLLAIQGIGLVADTLNSAGRQVFWLPLVYLIPIACALASWLFLFPSQQAPTLSFSAFAVWISFSINWLLPVGQVGGEIVRARMLIKRQFEPEMAIATVIGDQTLQVATQAIYALLGLVLFIDTQVEQTTNSRMIWLVLLGCVLFGLVSGGLYWLQHQGLFQLFARIARKFNRFGIVRSSTRHNSPEPSSESTPTLEEQATQIDAALKAMYQRRDRLLIATLWRFGFRLTAAAETWLSLYFLGHPVTVGEAIILESMGQAIRSAAFLIPGGLGAQEGGIMLIGVALGIPSDVALASSLCKRVRELTLGLPGLLAWQIDEGRRIFGSVDGDRPNS
ncbi:MAG: flippase-like domain-containing protein [Elainellaceae cyanobacterium]